MNVSVLNLLTKQAIRIFMLPTITHHGAVTGVTGSCHQYEAAGVNLLIDCGLFQGSEADVNLADFSFDVARVSALIVTHCHIDHVGRIPWLVAAGFRGPIYCSEPTAALLPVVLKDALEINLDNDHKLVELALFRIESQIVALPFNNWFAVHEKVQIRLQNAGHILGSAYVEISTTLDNGKLNRTVFSGDLGSPGAMFVDAVQSPEIVDTLVIETTYGDKNHTNRQDREATLAKLINKAMLDSGTLLIPAFSLGRTQELLSLIENLVHQGLIQTPNNEPLPVILDSPLARELTDKYRELSRFWPNALLERRDKGRFPLAFDTLLTISHHKDHLKLVKRLENTEQPAIVIAASGMCQGGRIMNYLEALIDKPSTDVLFVGYQARGTLGAQIQQAKHGSFIRFKNQSVRLNAKTYTVSGFSAHADQSDLLAFIQGIPELPGEIRLVHGDGEAKAVFADKLRAVVPGVKVVVP